MRGHAHIALLCAAAVCLISTRTYAIEARVPDAASQCIALSSMDFSRIPDALTQVIKTHLEQRSGDAPAFCEVSGYVAPSVKFLMRLPSENWNGKFIELGCG